MARILKPIETAVETSKSFDGKHEIAFNEKSHRYKWVCACHAKQPSIGVTTWLKSGYPTSMGLISWFKSQTAEALFSALTVPGEEGFRPRDGFWPINETRKKDLIAEAKKADKQTSQEMADIGTVLHRFSELHSLGKIEEANKILDAVRGAEAWPLVESCVSKYKEWDKTEKGELLLAESLIASPTYLYCGKIDRLDKVDGKIILRDYKTSKSFYVDQFLQMAAYDIAIKEWLGITVDGYEILRFGKEDGEFDPLLIDDPNEMLTFKEQALRCRKTFEFRKLEEDDRFDWRK